MTEELHVRVHDLRQRARNGEDIPPEEYATLLVDLRADRSTARKAAGKKAKEPAAPSKPLDLDAMFD